MGLAGQNFIFSKIFITTVVQYKYICKYVIKKAPGIARFRYVKWLADWQTDWLQLQKVDILFISDFWTCWHIE